MADARKISLRTYVYLDVLQPQLASFLATVSQGYLPIEEQASLFVEVQPGIAINRLTDKALKAADVTPGMQIVERAFGVLEVHSFNQGDVRAAGEAILDDLGLEMEDRLQPRVVTSEIITGTSPYQTMLINRFRHGDQLLKGQALYILETHPAGYAILAANEAEKASPIRLLEVVTFGAYGRLYLGGGDDEIKEAAAAAEACLADITGRPNEELVDTR
ncbi:MAG: BMC domain-containing protein [Planctomycetota bacterium]|nr:MAG: BMC domain-containing protein [Planctomycetota bacterium]